jgi:hypothetical protein
MNDKKTISQIGQQFIGEDQLNTPEVDISSISLVNRDTKVESQTPEDLSQVKININEITPKKSNNNFKHYK